MRNYKVLCVYTINWLKYETHRLSLLKLIWFLNMLLTGCILKWRSSKIQTADKTHPDTLSCGWRLSVSWIMLVLSACKEIELYLCFVFLGTFFHSPGYIFFICLKHEAKMRIYLKYIYNLYVFFLDATKPNLLPLQLNICLCFPRVSRYLSVWQTHTSLYFPIKHSLLVFRHIILFPLT